MSNRTTPELSRAGFSHGQNRVVSLSDYSCQHQHLAVLDLALGQIVAGDIARPRRNLAAGKHGSKHADDARAKARGLQTLMVNAEVAGGQSRPGRQVRSGELRKRQHRRQPRWPVTLCSPEAGAARADYLSTFASNWMRLGDSWFSFVCQIYRSEIACKYPKMIGLTIKYSYGKIIKLPELYLVALSSCSICRSRTGMPAYAVCSKQAWNGFIGWIAPSPTTLMT